MLFLYAFKSVQFQLFVCFLLIFAHDTEIYCLCAIKQKQVMASSGGGGGGDVVREWGGGGR